ncbi:MAG: NAD(P)-dependent alcohol dehydrogenase, partial [Acidobacteria bacterium]|nr:NAD(P)-dependent alcohol dehydrogenase [Acidobacteriota bacterium]
MPTMRAAVLTGYGGVERLELREIRRPEPGPGQLLVRVLAAAVNPIDWKIREGRLRLLRPARLPLVLGFDVAGEVAAIGPEVADFAPGDPVFAMLDGRHGGGYAEYAVTGESTAAGKPEALAWEEAAAVPLAGLTALQALRDLGAVEPGERLAVVGAAGGVGHFGVQLAAALGARVTAVAGPDHQDFVRRLGARRVIDYTQEDFTVLDDEPGGPDDAGSYEVIFDAAGVSSFDVCEPALAAGGAYVTTRPGPAIALAHLRVALSRLADRHGVRRAAAVHTRPKGADLSVLADLIAAGRLRPVIDRVYALDEVRQAHAASQAGHPRGKIVLRIAEGARTPADRAESQPDMLPEYRFDYKKTKPNRFA